MKYFTMKYPTMKYPTMKHPTMKYLTTAQTRQCTMYIFQCMTTPTQLNRYKKSFLFPLVWAQSSRLFQFRFVLKSLRCLCRCLRFFLDLFLFFFLGEKFQYVASCSSLRMYRINSSQSYVLPNPYPLKLDSARA